MGFARQKTGEGQGRPGNAALLWMVTPHSYHRSSDPFTDTKHLQASLLPLKSVKGQRFKVT